MIKKAFNSKRISTSFRINTVSLEIFFFMNENQIEAVREK